MFLKRIFDILFSFVGILLFCIPALFIFLLIKSTSRGPVIFTQKRVGKCGKLFTIYKFRTMHINSQSINTITTSNDFRITLAGKYLRKYKLDELPQLWNVLIGNMSFVGPRPDVAGYADKLQGEEADFLKMPPGITGPTSIYFSNEEEILSNSNNPRHFNDTVLWPQKIKINLYYYRTHNLLTDIGYIVITLFPKLDNFLGLIKKMKSTLNLKE